MQRYCLELLDNLKLTGRCALYPSQFLYVTRVTLGCFVKLRIYNVPWITPFYMHILTSFTRPCSATFRRPWESKHLLLHDCGQNKKNGKLHSQWQFCAHRRKRGGKREEACAHFCSKWASRNMLRQTLSAQQRQRLWEYTRETHTTGSHEGTLKRELSRPVTNLNSFWVQNDSFSFPSLSVCLPLSGTSLSPSNSFFPSFSSPSLCVFHCYSSSLWMHARSGKLLQLKHSSAPATHQRAAWCDQICQTWLCLFQLVSRHFLACCFWSSPCISSLLNIHFSFFFINDSAFEHFAFLSWE